MTPRAARAVPTRNVLGEGILWCARDQALYWTDIQASTLWRYQPETGALRSWAMPERLACLALCETPGWLLLGLASKLAFFHPASGRMQPITDVEPDLPTRLNDGACDRQGRFVFGTLHEPQDGGAQQPLGSFYRLNADLSVERLPLDRVAISNSLAFSPEGTTMYFCDTPSRRIQSCDYAASGEIGKARTFVAMGAGDGHPDGATIDADGGLWSAHWGAGHIVRYTADGRRDIVIEVPTPQPTRMAFGNRCLDTLYITSASEGLGSAKLRDDPQAGAVFRACEIAHHGVPEPRFAGLPAKADGRVSTRHPED